MITANLSNYTTKINISDTESFNMEMKLQPVDEYVKYIYS